MTTFFIVADLLLYLFMIVLVVFIIKTTEKRIKLATKIGIEEGYLKAMLEIEAILKDGEENRKEKEKFKKENKD